MCLKYMIVMIESDVAGCREAKNVGQALHKFAVELFLLCLPRWGNVNPIDQAPAQPSTMGDEMTKKTQILHKFRHLANGTSISSTDSCSIFIPKNAAGVVLFVHLRKPYLSNDCLNFPKKLFQQQVTSDAN
jgi:hypothetical protein